MNLRRSLCFLFLAISFASSAFCAPFAIAQTPNTPAPVAPPIPQKTLKDMMLMQAEPCYVEYLKSYNPVARMQTPVIGLNLTMNEDGSIAEIMLNQQTQNNLGQRPAFREVAMGIIQAVRACSPFKGMPLAQFAQWQKMEFSFMLPAIGN